MTVMFLFCILTASPVLRSWRAHTHYSLIDLTSLLQEQERQPSGFWRIRDGGQSKMVEKLWEYSCQGWGGVGMGGVLFNLK